jgi:hypothetical protein
MTDVQLEYVARALCRYDKLDPDEIVTAGYLDDMTSSEIVGRSSSFVTDMAFYIPRWRTYRGRAAAALAAQTALQNLPSTTGRGL